MIRIEKKEEIEKQKEMADGIREAAHHEEQRKRNKSQEHAAKKETQEEKHKSQGSTEAYEEQNVIAKDDNSFAGSSDQFSAKDDLNDPEVDDAFF